MLCKGRLTISSHAKVKPASKVQSDDEIGELHSHHAASRLGVGALCEPDGDDRCHNSETESSYQSPDQELRQSKAGALQSCAD